MGILQDFCILSLDLYFDGMHLLLLYDCLKSESSVVRVCAEVIAEDEDVVRLYN